MYIHKTTDVRDGELSTHNFTVASSTDREF